MTILSPTTREREPENLGTQNRTMLGWQSISGNQEEIRFKTSLQLCKYYNPVTRRLTTTYQKIAEELIPLGVSWRYVADIWKKHKESIHNSACVDLKGALAQKKGAGVPRCISIEDLHCRVRAVPFKDRKCIWSLGKKVGIPRATLERALKLGLLKTTKSHIKPIFLAGNVADMLWNVGTTRQCCSDFGQMGPCCRHRI